MKETLLVVAAHPDDELLGCAGTMAKYLEAGHDVHVLIMAEGMTSRDPQRDTKKRSNDLSTLHATAEAANAVIGVTSLTLLQYPDNRMDSRDLLDVVKSIEAHIEKVRPTIVLTHHRGDVNIDHVQIHDAVLSATRPLPGQTIKKVLFFETLSSTEWRPSGSTVSFHPNYFVDISDQLKKKIDALAEYTTEMRPWPHSRSLEAVEYLAKLRGATNGVDAAEAFILGRSLS
jgi:LmbE family N-acetylglucosaminyl deacetylase